MLDIIISALRVLGLYIYVFNAADSYIIYHPNNPRVSSPYLIHAVTLNNVDQRTPGIKIHGVKVGLEVRNEY